LSRKEGPSVRENGIEVLDISLTLADGNYFSISKLIKKGEFSVDLTYGKEQAGTNVGSAGDGRKEGEGGFVHLNFYRETPAGPSTTLYKRISYSKSFVRSIEIVYYPDAR
jgi:hypothetical protein